MRNSTKLPGPFWWLWASVTSANVGDGALKIALPLMAVSLTDSPAAIAAVPMALSLPWLFIALPAGALVDVWDRKRVMLVTDCARALLVGVLAIITLNGAASMPVMYFAAALIGVAEVFRDTAAQTVLPRLVGRDVLPAANGRLYATETAANSFVGPPLGGMLFGFGMVAALTVPSMLWAVAATCIGRIRVSTRAVSPSQLSHNSEAHVASIWGNILEGLRYLWRRRILRTLAAMVGVSNLAMSAMMSVFVLWAVGPESAMGLTEVGYGILLTSMAVGAVAGSLLASRVVSWIGRSSALTVTLIALAVCLATPALTTSAYLVGLVNVLAGMGMAIWNVVTVSLRQRVTPDRLLGRVNSAYRLLAWGTIPLGAALGGVIGEAAGVRWVFVISACITALLLVLVPCIRESALAAAEGNSAQEG